MLNPLGNSSRQNLREEILSQLNDPNNEFWSNDDINKKLQRVVTTLYNQNIRMNHERSNKTLDFYYEAGQEYMNIVNQIEITSSEIWIDVDIGGGEVSVSIEAKIYQHLGAVADALKTALRTLDSTFDVSYDESLLKFKIWRSANYTIKWSTGSHAGSTIGPTLGFDVSADDDGGNNQFVADNVTGYANVGRVKLVMLEDRTDRQPGPLWYPAESAEQQHQYNWILSSTEYYQESPKYIIKYIELGMGITLASDLTIFASPIPTSRRVMRLYYQGGAPVLDGDNDKSGLMPEEEEVSVLRTCILAKFQEIDKAPPEWRDQLKDAEAIMRQAIRPIKRGPKRITYIHD